MDHYIQGHVCGKDVDQWLRKHKGWFPDNQEDYGNGTPETQLGDEGLDVSSPHYDVLWDAGIILKKLEATLHELEDEEEIVAMRKKLRSIWSSNDAVGR